MSSTGVNEVQGLLCLDQGSVKLRRWELQKIWGFPGSHGGTPNHRWMVYVFYPSMDDNSQYPHDFFFFFRTPPLPPHEDFPCIGFAGCVGLLEQCQYRYLAFLAGVDWAVWIGQKMFLQK